MHVRTRIVALAALLMIAMASTAPLALARPGQVAFPETGQSISGRIGQFWETNGGLSVFGLPISCEGLQNITDPTDRMRHPGGKYVVQWFERFRLEKHGNHNSRPYDILLGLMGVDALAEEGIDWHSFPAENDAGGGGNRFFPETSHNVAGNFLGAWEAGGSHFSQPSASGPVYPRALALYGFPLSDRHVEHINDPVTPGDYSVQWFQRVRFEANLNNPNGPVSRGLLGTALYFSGGKIGTTPNIFVDCSIVRNAQALERFAALGLNPEDLAQDDTALFTQGEQVTALFTPATTLPIVTADEVAQQLNQRDLGELNNRPLGGLTITTFGDQRLPPGDYVLTLDSNGTVVFASPGGSESRGASVYRLPAEIARPIAFVTAAQQCLAWSKLAICADLPAPQAKDPAEQLKPEIERLTQTSMGTVDVKMEDFDFNQTVSLVVGGDEIDQCVRTLVSQEPSYDACTASVLAVPARQDGIFATPEKQTDPATGIGLLLVSQDLREEVYTDASLSKPTPVLPAGTYLVYDLQVDTVYEPVDGAPMRSALLLSADSAYFLPMLSASPLRGERVYGEGQPPGQDAAVAASLILRDRCLFRVGRCPGFPAKH